MNVSDMSISVIYKHNIRHKHASKNILTSTCQTIHLTAMISKI